MQNAAIQIARQVSALIPSKPAMKIMGGEGHRQEQLAYNAAMAAALAAWKFAAHAALNNAMSAAPDGWVVDHDNHGFVDSMTSIADLEAMCDEQYAWSGRRADQV